ncbi:hypothetical protein HYW87_00415, partial [Candidatus Roizmanbacteria bacterium]|nr:hypothetical protein [Candidatus Roizmanbacteria bacterium]
PTARPGTPTPSILKNRPTPTTIAFTSIIEEKKGQVLGALKLRFGQSQDKNQFLFISLILFLPFLLVLYFAKEKLKNFLKSRKRFSPYVYKKMLIQ